MSNDLLPAPIPSSTPGSSGSPGSGSVPSGPANGGPSAGASVRGPGRAFVIAALSVLAAVTVLWGTVSLADLVARNETTETFTRDTTPRLRISTDGAVQVTAGSVDSISVVRTVERGLRGPTASEQVVVTPSGDELVLSGDCPSFASGWCSVDYAVVVPAGTDVVVDSDAGSVTITGIDGDVTASTSAGSVTAVDLSGTLNLSSEAGRVQGEGLRSSVVDARSSAGSVRLVFESAPTSVDARSSAGSVEVVVPDDATVYAVDASTSAGATRIEVPTDPAADRSIRLRSSAGDVSLRHPS